MQAAFLVARELAPRIGEVLGILPADVRVNWVTATRDGLEFVVVVEGAGLPADGAQILPWVRSLPDGRAVLERLEIVR